MGQYVVQRERRNRVERTTRPCGFECSFYAEVNVQFAAHGQNGDFAVGEVEVVAEQGPGHHCGYFDEGVRDLFYLERQADFECEGRRVVAEEDYDGAAAVRHDVV